MYWQAVLHNVSGYLIAIAAYSCRSRSHVLLRMLPSYSSALAAVACSLPQEEPD